MENKGDSSNKEDDMLSNDNGSMNEELRKWVEEAKNDVNIPVEKQESPETSQKPSGKCNVCGEKNAKFICLKCKKSVCSSCYFKIIGVCKKCIPKDIVEKWEAKQPDWEKVLGVEWVD